MTDHPDKGGHANEQASVSEANTVTRGWRRLREALRPGPAHEQAAWAVPPSAAEPAVQAPQAWAQLCEQFAWRLLVLTEQLRPALDDLEGSEDDPSRLARLYRIDHGVTRMRQVARDMRVLAGLGEEEIAGHTTSLLDVIRMAASAIEHYSRVSIGRVAELAVVAYAADDVAAVLAALADNATRYSPSPVTVSAHLLSDGQVMLRVEDTGLGIDPAVIAGLNNTLAGPPPPAAVPGGRQTGFAVVHRLAHRHGLWVQLTRRETPGRSAASPVTGTIAMVVIPAALLCEIPEQSADSWEDAAERVPPVAASPGMRPSRTTPAAQPARPVPSQQDAAGRQTASVLPRRQPGSVRTPTRPPRPAQQQGTAADPATEGLAFASDVQSFSAALGTGQQPGAQPGMSRSTDSEGRTP